MNRRQITIKPSCMREIAAFPADRIGVLWEKIDHLVTDPLPDGKVKKKLQGAEGIYRLRVGDHRVFYRFGDEWLSLIGIRRRQEDTYKGLRPEDGEPELPPAQDDDLDALLARPEPPVFRFDEPTAETPLPMTITKEWLRERAVPESAWPVLLRCRTEDDLLEAPVSSDALSRVVDAMFPPALQAVARQPDLVVPSTEHLVRYREGNLLAFLLRLDDEQSRLTRWAMSGPTMVRGGAGTGKSTVALYRVKEVLERPGATGKETVLFTTYTRALLTVTRQLLEQILTPEQLLRVRIATCDQVAREIVAGARKVGNFESSAGAARRLADLRRRFVPVSASAFESTVRQRALARLSDEYLLEEFDWIVDGRGLRTLDEYRAAPRPGRGVPFPDRLRETVWQLHQQFKAEAPAERFPWIRNEAVQLAAQGNWRGHWDYVIVDEAQDLSPSALALLAETCKFPEGLFFAADTKQSLYSRSYSWTAVHPRLQFTGRTSVLKRNYRSTREIDRAAFGLLQAEEGEALQRSTSIHEGPLPVLARGISEENEADWIVRFVRQMARHLHLQPNAAAVLVPENRVGEELAKGLVDAGLPARFFAGKDLDLSADAVKVLTLHSAKGLEFPIVVVAGLHPGTYPVREDYDDLELFGECMRHERRLLYVGLTRAMRGLMLVVPEGCTHEAVTGLADEDWHVEEV